jgi:hypothetical protein
VDTDLDSEEATRRDGPTAHKYACQYSIYLDAGWSGVAAKADTKGLGREDWTLERRMRVSELTTAVRDGRKESDRSVRPTQP